MKLELLYRRENFNAIFLKTFKHYALIKFKSEAHISNKRKYKDSNIFLLNKKINIIYPSNVLPRDLRLLVKEFYYNKNPLKRLMQLIYITLAISKLFRWLFHDERFYMAPENCNLNQICIIPGNHSLRFIDLKNNTCTVLIKSGFNKRFINNEIGVRSLGIDIRAPEIINFSISEGWYEEKRIIATPINRFGSTKKQKDSICLVFKTLKSLYENSKSEVSLDCYLNELQNKFASLLSKLSPIYSNFDKKNIHETFSQLISKIENKHAQKISLVQSHGDLQASNILLGDGNEVYLIDWEYSDQRSIFYDNYVFFLNTRSPKNLSRRIQRFLNKKFNPDEFFFEKRTSKRDLVLFLLEELILRLEEVQIPEILKKDQGMKIFLEELNNISL